MKKEILIILISSSSFTMIIYSNYFTLKKKVKLSEFKQFIYSKTKE